jgi:hypothetical protein
MKIKPIRAKKQTPICCPARTVFYHTLHGIKPRKVWELDEVKGMENGS